MSDDRSERLRQARNRDPSKQDETSEPSEPSKPNETGKRDETAVKDERVGTYMYLPESQKKRIQRDYNQAKADYEFEYDDELEKNRHWYPLVAEYGLNSVAGLDAQALRDHLDEHGWL